MDMVINAKGYDFATWLIGIWRSFIGGGAGAVGSAFGNIATDPEHFNLAGGLGHTMKAMAVSFVIVGLVHMMIFLQSHSAPEKVQPGGQPQ